MNGRETSWEAGRAAAMNSAEQTVTWLITLGVLESPKKTISDPEGFLQASLKDGVVLCRLLERLLPGTIEKVSVSPACAPLVNRPRQWELGAVGGPAPLLVHGDPGCAETRGHGIARTGTWWSRAGLGERGRGGAHAPPLCADRERQPCGGRAGGARIQWRELGAPLCEVWDGEGAGLRSRGMTPRRPRGKGSALLRPKVESPLSVTRPEKLCSTKAHCFLRGFV